MSDKILVSELTQKMKEYLDMCPLRELCEYHQIMFPFDTPLSEEDLDDDSQAN
jgi:hypothetical protein